MKLSGIFAALTTPFDAAGEFQPAAMRANLAAYDRTALSGYLVLGTSGEAVLLNPEEKLAVLRAAAPASPGKIAFAGTAEESLRDTLRLTREAARLGYAAVLVRTPHYHKTDLTPAALLAYFRAVADASPLPVLAYNIPPLTGVDLSLEATLELAEHPNLVGLKDSSGNLGRLAALLAELARRGIDFPVLVGGGGTLLASLSLGAPGAILALAAAAPEPPLELYAAWRAGRTARAQDLQRALQPAAQALARHGVAGLKAAVELGGYAAGPPRLPLLPASPRQRADIAAAFQPLLAPVEAS